jgi:phage head maturation protease
MALKKNAAGVLVNDEPLAIGARAYGMGAILSVKDANGRAVGKRKGYDPEMQLVIHGMANRNMIDRYEEVLNPVGCDSRNFMLNPVLLAHHSYYCPIGQVTMVQPEDDGVHFEAWIGDPTKAPLTEMQQEMRSLVAQGILKTVSVGFIPRRIKQAVYGKQGEIVDPAMIEEWELLELSVVAVPCNPESVFDMKHLGPSARLFVDLAQRMGNATIENASQKTAAPVQRSVEQITEELAVSAMTVQTLVFAKSDFSAETAKAWAKKHGFAGLEVDDTGDSLRLRQRDPAEFDQETFRTIDFTEGVQAVVGKIKETKQEGDGAMEETCNKMLEILTGLVEAIKAIQAKLEDMTKKAEDAPEEKPADAPPAPKEDEGKALKETVTKLCGQVEKITEALAVLAAKAR